MHRNDLLLASGIFALIAVVGCGPETSEKLPQGKLPTPVEEQKTTEVESDEQEATDLPAGAKTPKDLVRRLARGVGNNDLQLLVSCFPSTTEVEREVAQASARTLLLQEDVRYFIKSGAEKFGKEEFFKSLGLAYFVVAPLAFLDYPKMAEEGEIELDEQAGTATVKRKAELGRNTVELICGNGKWYLKADLATGTDGTPANVTRYHAFAQFIKAGKQVLEKVDSIDDFKEQIAPHLRDLEQELKKTDTDGR